MEWDRWAAQRAVEPAAESGSEAGGHDRRLHAARVRRWIQRKAARAQARDPDGAMDTATRGPSAELPYRSEMERAFNQSFADVKVHTGQKEPMAQLGAHAATEGRTVAFADSQPDKKLVAHELTHVVQNRGGARSTGVSQLGQ